METVMLIDGETGDPVYMFAIDAREATKNDPKRWSAVSPEKLA